jgi:hypothetical protein
MLQWGVYSPDDVLAEEGENPQPNGSGKIYYRPANMGIVGEDGKITMPSAPAGGGDPKPAPSPKSEPGTETDNQPQRSEERCGGPGSGVPGPCPGSGKGKAKIKAPPNKVAKIKERLDAAQKKVDAIKAELKAAKADAKKVADKAKSEAVPKTDEAAKAAAKSIDEKTDKWIADAKKGDVAENSVIHDGIDKAIGKASPAKVLKEIGYTARGKTRKEALGLIKQFVVQRVGQAARNTLDGPGGQNK